MSDSQEVVRDLMNFVHIFQKSSGIKKDQVPVKACLFTYIFLVPKKPLEFFCTKKQSCYANHHWSRPAISVVGQSGVGLRARNAYDFDVPLSDSIQGSERQDLSLGTRVIPRNN